MNWLGCVVRLGVTLYAVAVLTCRCVSSVRARCAARGSLRRSRDGRLAVVEPQAFRFSGVGIIVRRVTLTSATCIAALIRTLMNVGERMRMRPKMRPSGLGWSRGPSLAAVRLPDRIRTRILQLPGIRPVWLAGGQMTAGNDDGGTACAEDRSVCHTILQLRGQTATRWMSPDSYRQSAQIGCQGNHHRWPGEPP